MFYVVSVKNGRVTRVWSRHRKRESAQKAKMKLRMESGITNLAIEHKGKVLEDLPNYQG